MSQFYKYPLPRNFDYLQTLKDRDYQLSTDFLENDILSLTLNYTDKRLPNHSIFKNSASSQAAIQEGDVMVYKNGNTEYRITQNPVTLTVLQDGKEVLESRDVFAGFNGDHTIFQFKKESNEQPFWGFGSKTGVLNQKNRAMKMWNNDVLGEHPHSWTRDDYDPTYASVNFFITYSNGTYIGLFLDNSDETFYNTGKSTHLVPNEVPQETTDEWQPRFYCGAYAGESTLYVMTGDTLGEVVQKYAKLTGVHELPPVWALGKHQCKFSYLDEQAIRDVIEGYEKNQLPLDCIWFDIDYMEKFKVFTWNNTTFSDPAQLIKWIHDKGVNAVTIIDPGVREEEGYNVYESGVSKNVFTKTHNGQRYIAQVWPGDTVMPDFSLEETKEWWSDHVKQFIDTYKIDGAWLDMNDPSTGPSERNDMLFQNGTVPHHSYHNIYGDMMSIATKRGLEKADAEKRSFILTRSGSAGIQQHAAVWTGDNFSSWEHLQMSIPQSVNLSLSGVSFNGPDVGGFMGETNEQLLTRWYQAGFLFPFFRNHNTKTGHGGGAHQEPYAFSKDTLDAVRSMINTRYKFLPYLYNTFHEHYATGSSVMRPLFYEFNNPEYFSVSDQFMTGPAIMQAPILTEENKRSVMLPEGKWYEWFGKEWLDGGKTVDVELPLEQTTLYLRDGYVIPVLAGEVFHEKESRNFTNVEFIALLNDVAEVSYTYYEDDGATQQYKNGVYNKIEITVKQDGTLSARGTQHGYPNGIKEVRVYVITATGGQEVSCPVSYDM
jgi:alpha-glucosidase